MIGLAILVAVLCMIPLTMWATRSRRRARVRWRGIDWDRGLSPAGRHAAEGARRRRAGDHARAIESFDQALVLEPENADALVGRAFSRHALGRLDDALADYDRAIALRGPDGETLNNRGCLQRDRGDLARAAADLEEAVRLAPDDPVAHVSLAEVLAQRGDHDAALAALARAVERDETWRAYARTAPALAGLREARAGLPPFD